MVYFFFLLELRVISFFEGENVVVLPSGAQYEVELSNLSDLRCNCRLEIDGESMFNMRLVTEILSISFSEFSMFFIQGKNYVGTFDVCMF